MNTKGVIKYSAGIIIKRFGDKFYTLLSRENDNWCIPKIRIKNNESARKAILKEFAEKIKINLTRLSLGGKICTIKLASLSDNKHGVNSEMNVFFSIYIDGKLDISKRKKISTLRWFEINNAFKNTFCRNEKLALWKIIKTLEIEEYDIIDDFVISVGGQGKRIASHFKSIGFKNSKVLFPIHGKSTLSFLINTALKLSFKKIFLLTSFYEKEIIDFLKKEYPKNKNIIVIRGGEKGKVGGVAYVLSLLKNELQKPFVYSDGNILYSDNLLNKLSSKRILKSSLISFAVSAGDLAPTHLKALIQSNKLLNLSSKPNKRLDKILFSDLSSSIKKYCSLGVMAIDNCIFDLLPEIKEMYDLDVVIEYLFKSKLNSNLELINFVKYNKKWFSFHDKNDIDRISKNN